MRHLKKLIIFLLIHVFLYICSGLECHAHPGSYHSDAIVTRLRYYCIAASVVGVKRLLSFDGCDGLAKKFEDCNLVSLMQLG
jgi:hypothetical protein